MYTVEYAKSGRAGCKACGTKIAKAELRIGKNVMLDFGRFGPEWYHYNCFWILEPNAGWTRFAGTSHLRLEDQQTLHLKSTGRPMSRQMVEEASAKIAQRTAVQEKAEEEVAAAAAEFTRSSPGTILYTFLQKHLDLLKVPELKAACKEHGLKLPTKAKRADIVKLIMEQKIEKVSGLAYHGVKKNCTIQELKEILKNSGLAVSGTKEDLIGRLMESQGATTPDLPLKYASQATPKKKGRWGIDAGDFYFSGHDIYEKDEEDSKLVQVAKSGTLAQLEAELAKLPKQDEAKRAAKLNHARRWTEVEAKWGYDKSWEWFGDTAMTAAARRGQVGMVAALLRAGADPTLVACPRDDVTEDAFKAGKGEATSKLLMIARKYWTVASYAGVSFSDERSKGFARNPNKPTDQVKLKQEVEAFEKQYKELQLKNKPDDSKFVRMKPVTKSIRNGNNEAFDKSCKELTLLNEAEDSEMTRVAESGTLADLEVELAGLPNQDKTAKLNQAARRAEVKMVTALLKVGADPTRTLWVAQSQMKNAEVALKEAEDGGDGSSSLKMSYVVDRHERAKSTLELLMIASKYWTKTSFTGVNFADEEKKGMADTLTDQAKLKQEIEASFMVYLEKCHERLQKRPEEQKRRRPDVVFQFKESASHEPASKKTKCIEFAVECLGPECTNPPAKKCPLQRCQKCCTGPCVRHKK